MAKLTRFQRSQNAHFNLRMKHAHTPGKKGDVLHRYHNNIPNMQKAMNETKGFERWSKYEGVRYLSVEKLKGNKQENMQIKKRKAR